MNPTGQSGPICNVTDVACDLAIKTEREIAAWHGLRVAEADHERGQIEPHQGAAKGDLVTARRAAGDLDTACTAQSGVQSITNSRSTAAVIQCRGGISCAALDQAQGELASTAGLDIDLLNFRLRRTLALLGVDVPRAGRSFAAKVELESSSWQGLTSQSTNKTHDVAIALAGICGVKRDLHIGDLRHPSRQAFVQSGIGRAHFADGGRHGGVTTINSADLLRRAVHQEQLVFLNNSFRLEHDAISRRLTRTARLHLGDRCGGLRQWRHSVTRQSQALQFAHALHSPVDLLHDAIGHEENVVIARHRRCGEDDVVDFGQTRLGRCEGADRNGDGCGGASQCLQRDLLDF